MRVFGKYGSKERLFEVMHIVNNLNEQVLPNKKKANKKTLKEYEEEDYNYSAEDFYSIYDEELAKIIDDINEGVKTETWVTIPFENLKRIWEDYIKRGYVINRKGVKDIKNLCIKNIAKLLANTELVGHTSSSPSDLITDAGYCFNEEPESGQEDAVDPNQLKLDLGHLTPPTPKSKEKYENCNQVLNFTEEEFFNRLDDYIGDDTFSDDATNPLIKLAMELIEKQKPEEELLICDQIFNVVHARGDIAALFVQGGSKALSQLSGEHADRMFVSEDQIKNKQRLFEVFNKVNKLSINEQVLPREEKNQIITEFVKFVDDKYKFGNKIPNITISYIENEAEHEKSFGKFLPQNKTIRVVGANRNLADILRTLAHELTHYKQLIENRIKPNSGKTGSTEENEANAMAGELLREFGRANPVIFE